MALDGACGGKGLDFGEWQDGNFSSRFVESVCFLRGYKQEYLFPWKRMSQSLSSMDPGIPGMGA